MTAALKVPFEHLVFLHHEIGCHRDRQWGFRAVFGVPTLQKLPFLHLASKVKRAYEGKDEPSHKGWPAQREALKWLVDRGSDGIYELDTKGLKLRATPFRSYYITDGNHRALSLYILGERLVRARLGEVALPTSSSGARRTRW